MDCTALVDHIITLIHTGFYSFVQMPGRMIDNILLQMSTNRQLWE